jgi:VCBS repeat-containing protein
MAPPISFDLSLYVRIGRYDLPEPTRTALPTGTPAWNLLAQEASAVTYNKDTDTLFVLGDGGTAIVQVDKTGKLIDTMTLAKGSSPQGTDFYDPEGLAYVGGGKFVFVEERDRQVVEFTYKKDATLARSDTKTVKLGTTIGNIGLEGIAFDTSATNSYVLVKESGPEGIFLTSIDFSATTAGTTSNGGVPVASNGSSTTANSTNLFDPAKAGLNDFADVYALSNVPALTGTSFASHLLILSQESGKVVDIGRDGTVYSSLTLQLDAGSTLSVADQTHEGLAMDAAGNIYIVSENGGGDVNHPQLWVYAVSTAANKAPTSVVFNNPVTSILENIPITTLYKLADVAVVDDGLGTNALSVSGADAASFQVDATGLYLKTGTVLDYETKKIYEVSVNVDDVSVGTTPDASKAFSLTLIDVVNENVPVPNLAITEASPWSSGNSLYKADWFEITNIGSTTVDLTGLRFDDDSNAFGSSVPLQGVSSLAPGKSAVFLEAVDTEAATISQLTSAFKADWFGANVPSGFQIGTYTGAGVGLSTGGDALNLFDQFGRLITGIKVGASTTYKTFTNDTAAGSSSFPTPTVSTLSTLGTNGAFASAVPATGTTSEIGSPGKVAPLYNFSAGTYGVTEGTVAGALSNGTVRVNRSGDTSAASSVVLELAGGTAKGAAAAPVEGTSTGPSTTTTPYVLPAAGSGVATKSLLTVGDSIGGYKMAGIPDGLGAFDNGDGTFTLLMNHEIGNTSGVTRAHGGKGAFVSSWVIRKSDLTVVSGADLIQNIYDWDTTTQASKSVANNSANSNGFSLNRFCSADLAAPTAFYNAGSGLGSQAKIFLNGEEGGATGFALANIASGTSKGNSYVLGKFSLSTNGSGLTGVGGYENLLANWFAQDKTVVIGNNDGGTGLLNNAVVVYQGTKTNSGSEADKAGLNNGTLKFVSVAGISAEISDATTQATAITSGTRFSLSTTASTTFARPEDGAWDPTDANKYYFVTTDRIDNASDGNGTQIGVTRLWRLTFDDIKNPDLGGKIDLLVDGDMVNGKKVNMFDNISIDSYGHILLQEDVGNAAHNGKIYQYDIATDTVKLLAQHDAARFGDVGLAATSPFSQDEETSGIIDMEPILGAGWSLFVDQAHYTTGISTDLVEGGQLLAMFNPDIYKSSQPDYINTAQMVAFAAGESSKDVLVPIYGDTRLEGPETFNLSLSNPSSGSVVGATQPTATVTIQDPATYNFSAGTYGVTEGTVAGALSNGTVRVNRSGDTSAASSVVLELAGGTAKGAAAAPVEGTSTGPSTTTTPYVLPAAGSGVATKSLLTVGDSIGGYKMAGIPDGLGAFDNGDGTFTLLMNHEIGNTSGVTRAHGGKGAFVSSWVIRKSDLTVVSGADLIQNIYDWDTTTQASKSVANNSANSNGFSLNRFCSADLAAPTAFYNAGSGLGSQAKIFLNGEEGGATGFALANIASGTSKGNSYVLGKFSLSTNGSGLTGVGGYENLLANWFAQDKTVVIGNNDGGTGLLNNAVVVYQGTKTNSGSEADKAGLNNGTLKFVSVAGISAEISDATTQATAITSGTRFSLSTTASTTFARPEDGAWDPTDANKYYFVTTDRIDNASDGNGTQIGVTRLWRLTFDDIKNPDLGGKIDLLVDGDMVNGKKVNMFDNISIDSYGHILLQEDVGNAAHNGKIYQYDIATDTVKLLAQHDAARFGDVGLAATSPFSQDEETSGIIDMEPILGAGWSLFVDQAHYTTGISTDLVEGGQLLAMFNPDIYKSSQPDYINTAQMVAFAAGESSKDVLVPIYGDTRLEGPETFNLSLSNPSSGSVVGATQPTATVTIADRALISGTATASVKEGTGVNASGLLVATGNLSVSDFDAGEAKFNTAVVPASGNFGSLTITEAGAYTYSLSNTLADVQNLAAGQTKIDTFTVKSFDGTASKDIVVTINGASAAFNAVAAGDPTTNRVTLWTRTYDTSDTSRRTGITEAVTVQVATDAAFNTIVFTADGQTSAADHDYTVKIDATGLQADTTFYYRYKTKAGELSSTGTFKSAQLASSDGAVHIGHSGDIDGLMRPYPLMVDLAAQKFDAFIFNGDTMYETLSTGSPATPSTRDAAIGVVTQQALLDAYHRKYLENLLPTSTGTYSGLKDFFAAQANFTTWDNHELGNKAYINGGAPATLYNSSANGSSVVANDVNTTSQYINDLVTFDTLQQAFLDYQPIRTPEVINAPGDPRSNGELKLYGTQQYGQNAQIFNLDTRTFRDVRLNKAVGGDDTGARADNPDRTVLGATQKAWLKQALLDAKTAGVTWKFINITDPIDMIGGYDSGLDGGKSWWGGYRAERNELLKFIDDNNIKNVIFLASDDHQGRINELTYLADPSLDPTKPANYKTLDRVFSIVDGPMGATGPDFVTDHSFTNVKALADTLAANQLAAGINPIGLDKNFTGLFNVYREGDATATTSPKAVDFYAPDTNNYVSLDVTPEGVLTVSLRGINSYAQNSFPEPSAANAARTILSFSIDGNPILAGTAGVDSIDPGSSTVPTFTGEGQKLATGSGNDVLDLALISGHDNVVFAGSGSDMVYAGERDVITGGIDADTIWAINGDGNRLDGGKGDDIFYIGSKGNRALGGEGADRFYIQDGAGTNYFNGGAGADEFWLVSGPGEYPAAKQFVMDFKVGQDKVGLQGVSFTSLRFSQVGVDTLLKVAGVEVGQFSNVSVSTLNSQSNFIGLG